MSSTHVAAHLHLYCIHIVRMHGFSNECMLSVCSRCWTLVFLASNACRWLTAVLKRRFHFIRRFLRFIASLACCNPNACCPPLCFDFAPRFASFSALCPVFCILHCFPAPLHGFPHPFALLSAFCIVLRILQYFSHHFPCLFCFIACMSPALLGFPTVLFYRLHLHIGP